jgi:hypothetical protein
MAGVLDGWSDRVRGPHCPQSTKGNLDMGCARQLLLTRGAQVFISTCIRSGYAVADGLYSELHANGMLNGAVSVLNPNQGSRDIRNESEMEFRNFVMETYEEMYAIEARVLSGKPSICLFCRLDIGLIVGEDGSVNYFVNEVERTQTTSLWSNRYHAKSPVAPTGILGDTFAHAFYEWLLSMSNPYTIT